MNWWMLGFWLLGMPVAAYLIGRFTQDDVRQPTHVIRDMAFVFVLFWPMLFLLIPAMAMAGLCFYSFKVGEKQQVDLAYRLPAYKGDEHTEHLEKEIGRLEKLANRIRAL